ncbi:hypothetical protein [Mesorhizobium sp. M1342]|uniref:hypothetical protein n=1 Tax=Mesorhizobium sp. M1342 TaxID=2957088 RepID=UPI00333870A4
MRLAGACPADQDDIALIGDEGAGGEIADQPGAEDLPEGGAQGFASLIDFPRTSDSRRIFAIVSTTNIQNTNASDQTVGILMAPSLRGPVWTKITP